MTDFMAGLLAALMFVGLFAWMLLLPTVGLLYMMGYLT
jgi:hypothetical protein